MAESSEGKSYTKLIQKNFNRTVEKVMNTIGKSDKTADEEFDKISAMFSEQQATAVKVQKEMKNFIAQARAMSAASLALQQVVRESYEPDWEEFEEFRQKSEKISTLWTEYLSQMEDFVVQPINNYVCQFPELKNKIAKRGRKLMDYDIARHNLHSLESSKKRDEFKITRARDELTAAKTVYENLNDELFRELPTLYNSRHQRLCCPYDAMFSALKKFTEELAEVSDKMGDMAKRTGSRTPESVMDKHTTYTTYIDPKYKRTTTYDEELQYPAAGTSRSQTSSEITSNRAASNDYVITNRSTSNDDVINNRVVTGALSVNGSGDTAAGSRNSATSDNSFSSLTDNNATQQQQLMVQSISVSYPPNEYNSHGEVGENGGSKSMQVKQEQDGETVLYKVLVTNDYKADDSMEEIDLIAGNIVNVLQPANDDDIDAGWLLGQNTNTGRRGLFPANFTRKIDDE